MDEFKSVSAQPSFDPQVDGEAAFLLDGDEEAVATRILKIDVSGENTPRPSLLEVGDETAHAGNSIETAEVVWEEESMPTRAESFRDEADFTSDQTTSQADRIEVIEATEEILQERPNAGRRGRRYEDEDPSDPKWAKHEKHFFVLSTAGKPIYSRYGNEDKLATIMGVMQALVSFVSDENDTLLCVNSATHKFVFLHRSPVILVCVSSTLESETQLGMQLTYVYNQIISVLTLSQLNRIFEQRGNYDLRRLLAGTEKFIDSLLSLLNYDPSFLLGAVRCLPLPGVVRDKVGQILNTSRCPEVVFAVLFAQNQLITILRPKKHSLHPSDIHLLFNLVHGSTAFQSGESWTPICLPKFSNQGFLHAHVSYLDDPDCKVCLMLLTTEKDAFFQLSACRGKIQQRLETAGLLRQLRDAMASNNYRVGLVEIPELRHFVYNWKGTSQFTAPQLEAPYNDKKEQKRLFRLYQYLHHRIYLTPRPLKMYYHVGERERLLGFVAPSFELFATFSPLASKAVAIDAVNKILRWIKQEQEKLFIINSHVF
eukprot:Colp12_sorted_trinity150504_noHs@516